MKILDFKFENWYTIDVKLNWFAAAAIMVAVFLVSMIWKRVIKYIGRKSIDIDEMTLGIGSNKVTLKYNRKSQEIAYKLWVELSTRKIGIEFEPDNDVISDVYDSWYHFFSVARDLLKELPPEQIEGSKQLIQLTEDVLNKGLRPHLTRWQAKYRLWQENNLNDGTETPQEFQHKYPEYDKLARDIIETNKQLIEYKKLMKEIAFR